jgi:diguanylate cyclase (GGDEF)-like protein
MAAMSVPTTRNGSLLRLFAGADRAVGRQSELDELTGLPSRAVFERRLERLLSVRHQLRREQVCTVLLIDCDGFREINQSVGYLGGDRVLAEIAERLRDSLPGAHTIARVGGDEFAVLLDEVPSVPALLEQAERIVAGLHEPLEVAESPITISTSVGIVLCTREDAAAGALEVLRSAAVALQLAKQRGKARFGVFEASMHVALANPDREQPGLDSALGLRQYTLWFQPIVRLPEGSMVGIEALLRWRHPDGRVLEAAEFLPELEATGLIVEAGRWVVAEACAQAAALRNDVGADLFVMVNINASQLADSSFVETVLESIERYALEPGTLVVELTESNLLADDPAACAVLNRLRDQGVRIAVDDVGGGYSTMSHLQRMPVDVVKVAPVVVNRLAAGPQGPSAADDLFLLARSLGMDTIAEHVETLEQHDAVVRTGCGMAQGFYYAPPLTPQELAATLRSLLSPG